MSLTRMLCFAGCLLLAGAPSRAADVTATWNGSSGLWSDVAKWNTAHYPNNGNGGLTYDAVISSGTATIPALTDIIIEALTFSGGQIGGEGSLQLNAASTWSGGTLAGTGAGLTLAAAVR